MESKRKFLPTPATVIACLALIAALGGTAYAAAKINGADIKKDSVTGKQVKEKTLTGVDAKKLRGEKPGALQTRWFILNEQGEIEDQSGGFTVLDAYDTNTNAYIDTGKSLEGKGLTATVAIQNQIDLDGVAPGVQGSRNGQATVSRCQIPGVVDCAPPNAKIESALVVSPSNGDGSPAATASPGTGPGTATKRIYVTVTE